MENEKFVDVPLVYCNRCEKVIMGFPALSRWDNKSPVCSDCGQIEAIEDWERSKDA